jgi:hypothetical protein
MAYEHPSAVGTISVMQIRKRWQLHFAGRCHGRWPSPDAAMKAAARHESGLSDWDRTRAEVSDDLLDWRPLGESL